MAEPTPLRRLFGSAAFTTGAAIVLVAIAAALAAGHLTPYDPVTLSPAERMQGPSAAHLLGTDQYGRDTFTRLLWGSRTSLSVAFAAVGFALGCGTLLGVLAGYFRGWTEMLALRVTDILLSFPAILLAIALLAFLGGGFRNLVLAIGLVYIGPFVRVARAAVLTVREELYVESSVAVGSRDWRTMLLTVLPNASAPLIVETTLRLAYAILAEASLSFLGLGAQPPAASLGQMIAEGRSYLALTAWPTVAPGLAIMVVVLGLNLLGDGLRDVLDPRIRSGAS